MIKRLAENPGGHDFVVGDLHGCRHLLEARLGALGFNPETDRVISVGDLVDRGPDSWGSLKLIEEPWFHFVIGNHEEMLLDLLEACRGWAKPKTDDPDLAWVNDLDEPQIKYLREVLAPKLVAAPLAMQVGDGPDRFYIVHADRSRLSYTRPIQLLDDAEMEGIGDASDEQKEVLIWSRRLDRELPRGACRDLGPCLVGSPAMETGVGLTFVGHTIIEKPILYRSHLNIDTGAFVTGNLTVLRVQDVMSKLLASGMPQ